MLTNIPIDQSPVGKHPDKWTDESIRCLRYALHVARKSRKEYSADEQQLLVIAALYKHLNFEDQERARMAFRDLERREREKYHIPYWRGYYGQRRGDEEDGW